MVTIQINISLLQRIGPLSRYEAYLRPKREADSCSCQFLCPALSPLSAVPDG